MTRSDEVRVDFSPVQSVSGGVEQSDDIERGAERLINELLTRVGMIMEDVSLTALLRDSYAGDLPARIAALLTATKQITVLISAAEALLHA